MGKNLSPDVLRREFENLDKDAASRMSAMKALNSYIKDLDSEASALFLAQVPETEDSGSPSGERSVSLYEVLARVNGSNIVPQINTIMPTIIKTLTSSAGSFPLQQACSKVVPAIARYAINPSTPKDKKKTIIQSLCKPLSDSLLGPQESLAFGAALCLKALVDSDNWKFAPDELVNEVCLKVAVALQEKPTQSNSHMSLAMALAKHNSLIIEAFARTLIRSGLGILNSGEVECNSQKRLSAIQMVHFLMKCVDPRSIFSELENIIEEMEKCNSDQMEFVNGAAYEALQTAKVIAEKGSKFDSDPGSVTGSNFGLSRGNNRQKQSWGGRESRDGSLLSVASPESQTVSSFSEYDSFTESPMSTRQSSRNYVSRRKSINRKLWRTEIGRSSNDRFYSNCSGSNGSRIYSECFEDIKTNEDGGTPPRNGLVLSASPSHQRYDQFNVDDSRIYTTPRELIRSLQDLDDANSDYSSAEPFRNVASSSNSDDEPDDYENSETGKEALNGSESVSSTCDIAADVSTKVCHEVSPESRSGTQIVTKKRKSLAKVVLKMLFSVFFFISCAILLSTMSADDHETSLVPT